VEYSGKLMVTVLSAPVSGGRLSGISRLGIAELGEVVIVKWNERE
jgi:hypothetical protein